MKKLARFFICFTVIIWCQLASPPVMAAAEAAQTPAEAVSEMMEAMKNLDVAAFSSDTSVASDIMSQAIEAVLTPVLPRLDYVLGNSKITGNRASVDMSVTAADVGGVVETVAKQAAGLVVISRVLGISVNIGDFVLERVKEALDDESLTTISTDTTVFLITGGDGKWKLDLSEEKNLGFLKALSGGAADLEEPVRALLSSYDSK